MISNVPNPLTDTFGRFHSYLRISVTDRCNLRCRYCMPAEGIPLTPRSALLTFEEITQLVTWLAECGVSKVRITGGEPTVRRELPRLFESLNGIPALRMLAMTSNGLALDPLLDELVKHGLRQLNISLDALTPDVFQSITRRSGLDRVLAVIARAASIPELTVKVNMVVIRGVNDREVLPIIRQFQQVPMELRFIEFMPFSGNDWSGDRLVSKREIIDQITRIFPVIPMGFSDDGTGTSDRFRLRDSPLTIGVIASMTDQFCGTCSRIRLTADGMFKSCLFENNEVDLKTPLRAGAGKEDILALIANRIRLKKASHGGMQFIADHPGRTMIAIGG